MANITSLHFPVDGGDLPVTVAQGSEPGPAVAIVPSIFGVAEDLVGQMGELADEGAYVCAMDPFFRQDPGPVPYEDFPRAAARKQALDIEQSYRDFQALVRHARTHGNGRVLGLGICFGGPFCLLGAADGLLDGVVTWHGSNLDQYLARADEMRVPMRLHFGSQDSVVPLEAVEQINQAFEGREEVEIVVHQGASHGFSHPQGPSYDETAERAAMEAVKGLLATMHPG